MIRRDRFDRGTHNSLSDRSAQKYKRKDMRLTWDNQLVGNDEWEPKQPQLTIRPRPDNPEIKNQTRVEGHTETLIEPSFNPAGQV
jgi:hypothetical protein